MSEHHLKSPVSVCDTDFTAIFSEDWDVTSRQKEVVRWAMAPDKILGHKTVIRDFRGKIQKIIDCREDISGRMLNIDLG